MFMLVLVRRMLRDVLIIGDMSLLRMFVAVRATSILLCDIMPISMVVNEALLAMRAGRTRMLHTGNILISVNSNRSFIAQVVSVSIQMLFRPDFIFVIPVIFLGGIQR